MLFPEFELIGKDKVSTVYMEGNLKAPNIDNNLFPKLCFGFSRKSVCVTQRQENEEESEIAK